MPDFKITTDSTKGGAVSDERWNFRMPTQRPTMPKSPWQTWLATLHDGKKAGFGVKVEDADGKEI